MFFGIPDPAYIHPVVRMNGIGNEMPKGYELPGCILDQCCTETPAPGIRVVQFEWYNFNDPGEFIPGLWRLILRLDNPSGELVTNLQLNPTLPMQTGFGVEMPAWIPGDDFNIVFGSEILAGGFFTRDKFVDVVVPLGLADHVFTYTIPVGSITGIVNGVPVANTQAVSATMHIAIQP